MQTTDKHRQWLMEELPAWQTAGLVDAAAAERIREHYAAGPRSQRVGWAIIACGILGALFVGAGIILLVAHNWEQLTRSQRSGLAFAPLLCGIGMVGFTILRRWESVAWREASAGFLTAGVGTAIALVSQTYHIMGDLDAFLLVWLALAGPLVYLLNSSVVAVLAWLGLLCWAGTTRHDGGSQVVLFWPMTVCLLPHLRQAWRAAPGGTRAGWLCWALGLGLCVAPALARGGTQWQGSWILMYAALFAVLHFAAQAVEPAGSFWRAPLRNISAGGIVVLALIFSFPDVWGHVGWWSYDYWHGQPALLVQDWVLVFGMLAVAICCLALQLRRRRWSELGFGALALLATLGYTLRSGNGLISQEVVAALFSLYLLALGVALMRAGWLQGRLAPMNGGLVVIALMAGARFVDQDISALVRGFGFIIIGIGFLVSNMLVLKRRQEVRV